jgi:hypothetical protein
MLGRCHDHGFESVPLPPQLQDNWRHLDRLGPGPYHRRDGKPSHALSRASAAPAVGRLAGLLM